MVVLFSILAIATFSLTLSTDLSFAVTDRDYDKDGLLDAFDECPLRSETYNQFEDFDGCPDSIPVESVPIEIPDIDGDGIEDRLDSCLYEPETINDYLDDDGCPEIVPNTVNELKDSDFDTIIDSMDACPTEKENFNGLEDEDGCSDSWNLAIDEDTENSVNLYNECRPGMVLVIRLNSNDSVCVPFETAKKWESYGIIKSLEVTPPTEVPPTEVPPTEVPPTEVPPTEVPPTEVPPTEKPYDPITPPSIPDEIPTVPEDVLQFNLTEIIKTTDYSFVDRPDKEKRNVETIIVFLSALSPWDQNIITGLLADDYHEHNPNLPGTKTGFIKNLNQQYTGMFPNVIKYDLKRIYADNDYVITHSHFQSLPGVNAAKIDIFKINEDGKINEHWDIMQEIPDSSLNNNTIFYLD